MRHARGSQAADNERAWRITLGAGAVVALVVWGLLERLRRAVDGVERDVDKLWTTGKQLAQQTQAGHLLVAVSGRAQELADEAAHHAPALPEVVERDSSGDPL